MLVCFNQRTNEGCGALNDSDAEECRECGMSLRFALRVTNPLVQDCYRIIRGIGYGRFGAVYLAEDTRSADSRLVALKESFEASDILAYRREFRVLQHIEHPNLPHYHDMFEYEGSGYMVMEYVPGQSLEEILKRRGGPLLEGQVMSYMWQICDVLHYLHNEDPPIIHRDIKPANIRLTPEGVIKLVDFGLVKHGTPQDTTTISGYTPGYAAPEQLVGGGTGPRSDVYSLGATLYHLLTDTVPPSAIERIIALPHRLLETPRSLNPNISLNLSYIIGVAMSITEVHRYPDIATLKRVLFGEVSPMVVVEPDNAPKVTELDQQQHIGSYNIAWSPDSGLLAGAYHSGNCVLWDIRTGGINYLNTNEKYVWGLAFSPNGELLAMASEDQTVHLWNVHEASLLHQFEGHTREVWRVAFSPDGELLASASWDTTVKLWRIPERDHLHTLQGHESGAVDVAFAPGGHVVASSSRDTTIRLWSPELGTLLNTLSGHEGTVYSIAFSPDGSTIVSVSDDQTVKLWNVQDGSLLKTLSGHEGPVIDVAFSPNGQLFATSAKDKTVRLWHFPDGTLLHTLQGHTDTVSSVIFAPDGKKLASAAQDFTVRLWGVL